MTRKVFMPWMAVSCLLAVTQLAEASSTEEKKPWFSWTEKKVPGQTPQPGRPVQEVQPDRPVELASLGIPTPELTSALPHPPSAGNPLAPYWNSDFFLKRFADSYGFHPILEPKLRGTNESNFIIELGKIIPTDPAEAARRISTNLTANSSAVFDFTLATLQFQQGETQEAEANYKNAIEKHPKYLRAHQNLSQLYVKEGRFADAIPHLTESIRLGGADGLMFGLLGFAFQSEGQFLASEGAYRSAMLYMPDNKDWKLGLVKALMAQEKFTEANRLVTELLGQNPQDASLWSLQAGLFMQMEQTSRAIVNFEILRRLGKANLQNLMLLGDLYMIQGGNDLALEVYLEGVAQDGESDLRRSLRAAEILVNNGDMDRAVPLFEKIRSVHGSKLSQAEELKLLKLQSKVSNAKGDTEGSVAVLEKVVEQDPLDGEALLMLGNFYVAMDQPEKAQFRYELASKIEGFEADAYVKQAQLFVRKQEKTSYRKAITLLEKAQKIRPRDSIQRYLEAIQKLERR